MSIIESSQVTERDAKKKVVLVGDGGCGKTCMLLSYTTGKYPEKYVPTVFESYVYDMKYEKKIIEVGLWDTAGQEDYDRLRPLAYPDTDVILLCFALDNRAHIRNLFDKVSGDVMMDEILGRWYPEIKHFCEHVPIVLVGCKRDLRDDTQPQVSRPSYVPPRGGGGRMLNDMPNPISTREGHEIADKIGAKYVECSAKDQESMREVFRLAMKTCMGRNLKKIKKKVCSVM